MELGLAGKTALITASTRGLGRACALALAAAGARVAVCGRGAQGIESTLNEIGGRERGHIGVALDLTSEAGPGQLAAAVTGAFGALDIVIHALGGTLGITSDFPSVADWRRVWRANIEVALELNGLIVPAMVERGAGRVIHICTSAALEHSASIPYSSSKASLMAYARAIGRNLVASGVVACAVLPGRMPPAPGEATPDYAPAWLRERDLTIGIQTPGEVAEFILFLCSQHAKPCAGGVFRVDGGLGRAYFG